MACDATAATPDPATSTRLGALVDREARARIVADHDATLFVEAGAGTGKTSALVGRIVDDVVAGRSRLGELAAITFTEAAAAELRSRIGEHLAELSLERPTDPRVLDALGELDDAVVTTIHGFAQRILADHLLAAGLPLEITVLDEFEAEVDFERRFGTLFDEMLDDGASAELIAAGLVVGITPRHLEELSRRLDEMWHVASDPTTTETSSPELAPTVRVDVALVERALNDACRFAEHCLDPTDSLGAKLVELQGFAPRELDGVEWLSGLRWLASLPTARVANRGAKARWTCPIEDVRDAIAAFDEARADALARAHDGIVTALVDRLAHGAVRAAAQRRRAGTLRFHDLLVFARDLLASNPVVRAAVQRRFTQLLVDEFQDTDELQLEIVRLVAGELPGEEPRPGRLFFVGDPKQAIYRFRGADVELYHRVRASVAGDDVVRLTTNFRSVPGVLEWVNATFEQLLDGATGDPAPGWSALDAARPGLGHDGPSVTVLGGPSTALASADRRALESTDIAGAVACAVRDGWPVEIAGDLRRARYRDIAILIPSRTGLDELEAALDHRDIPYRVQSSTLVYASTEVRDLFAVIRAIDSPGDEATIVAALRTPELACRDDELLAWRRGGGDWRLDRPAPSGLEDARVARALASLAVLHATRHELGIARLVVAVVDQYKVRQLAGGLRRREEVWRRIDRVLDDARAFDAAGGSLAELLEWAERQAVRSSGATAWSDPDEDAVQILTVHGAKGLEFPIVALADLGARPAARRGVQILLDRDGRLEVRLRAGLETLGYAALAAGEAAADRAEQLRLCYVAATRARDHLIVPLHHESAAAAPSIAERLWHITQDHPELWQHGAALHRSAARPAVEEAATTPPLYEVSASLYEMTDSFHSADLRAPEGIAQWSARRAALVERIRRPASLSATSLESPVATPRRARTIAASVDPGAENRLGWYPRRAATELGRAVHGVLQRIDLDAGTRLVELAASEAARHGVEDRIETVVELVRSALATDIVRAAARAEVCRREVPVSAVVGDGILDGVVDLLFVDEAGALVVVDYKTDALDDVAAVPAAAERYQLQVGAYVLALTAALQRPVERCVLVFLAPPNGAVEYEWPDLELATRAAGRELAARFGGPGESSTGL